jgi:hypothetical protein
MRIRMMLRRPVQQVRHAVRRAREQDFSAGMATAEYAVGIVAACGFAGLLVTLLKSAEVRTLLFGIIKKALGA